MDLEAFLFFGTTLVQSSGFEMLSHASLTTGIVVNWLAPSAEVTLLRLITAPVCFFGWAAKVSRFSCHSLHRVTRCISPKHFRLDRRRFRREHAMACRYQRGLTYKKRPSATKNGVCMWIFLIKVEIEDLGAFLEIQELRFRMYEPNAEITYRSTVSAPGKAHAWVT